jgi:hypothetical protein
MPSSPRTRARVFVALVVICVTGAGVAIASALGGGSASDAATASARQALPAARAANRPVVVYRSLVPSSQGRPAIAPLDAPAAADPELAPLNCDRVHFDGGTGVCLARGGSFAAGYRAQIFGPDLRVREEVDVAGIASRVRVSPDGRWGSVTLFVTGHSYEQAGAFSTETTLIDLARGERIAQLEDFTVSREGRIVTSDDVNFWGVTFVPGGDRFYATLATGGRTYLVEGSVGERRMRTLHENVECPSLSPDGTRIAYKKRVGSGPNPWRLTVLELATMRETPLTETRSVDDQAEWLDEGHILYGVDDEIRVVATDGTGRPRRLRAEADSPAVVRWQPPRKIGEPPPVGRK